MRFERLTGFLHEDKSEVAKLIEWCKCQCDGEWEKQEPMSLGMIDNPGWTLNVNLAGTSIDGRPFESISEHAERSEKGGGDGPWHECFVKDNRFIGYGDMDRMPELIRIFLTFAQPDRVSSVETPRELQDLIDWGKLECNEDWEHGWAIGIDMLANPGWSLRVGVSWTYLEERPFEPLSEGSEIGGGPWYSCSIIDEIFVGRGDMDRLPELIRIFLRFADPRPPKVGPYQFWIPPID